MQRRSGRRICHINKLHVRLKVHILSHLISPNFELFGGWTSIKSKIECKMYLKIICVLFRDCMKSYGKLLEQFNLEYYLRLYARKYCDVFKLANSGYHLYISRNLFPCKLLKYSGIGISDPNKYQNHGQIVFDYTFSIHRVPQVSIKNRIVKCSVTFINEEKSDYYMIHNNFDYLSRTGPVFKQEFIDCENIGRILISRKSLPFLCEENILLSVDGVTLNMESNLSVEKFKELINLKEGRAIFTIIDVAKK